MHNYTNGCDQKTLPLKTLKSSNKASRCYTPFQSFRACVCQSDLILTCFYASFFPFWPLCWPSLFLPFFRHVFAPSPLRKVLCDVERRAHHTAWRGAIQDASPRISGRNFLPEICVKKVRIVCLAARKVENVHFHLGSAGRKQQDTKEYLNQRGT